MVAKKVSQRRKRERPKMPRIRGTRVRQEDQENMTPPQVMARRKEVEEAMKMMEPT